MEQHQHPVHIPTKTIDRICIDLDGILAEPVWPKPAVGAVIPEGADLVKYYFHQGFEVIIFTSRPEDHKTLIWNWLSENDLIKYIYEIRCDKPLAQLYIDDKAWRPDYVG